MAQIRCDKTAAIVGMLTARFPDLQVIVEEPELEDVIARLYGELGSNA